MNLATAAATWEWLIHSNAGLATRIAVGAAILATLAAVDLRRNGRRATRWREYVFLLAVTAIVLVYGIVNDQITCTISWEYFYYGKGLDETLGEQIPPDPWRLRLGAAMVALKATWSAGLIVGVALLLANNPSRSRDQLPFGRLFRRLPTMLLITALTSAAFAVLGYAGLFTRFSEDFRQMLLRDEFRPRRFMAVFGVHLGGYAGAMIATAYAVLSIRRERLRARSFASGPSQPAPPEVGRPAPLDRP